jgi:hypothetical protein
MVPSQQSQQQILQDVHVPADHALNVNAEVTAVIGDVEVSINSIDDNITIGDASGNLATVTNGALNVNTVNNDPITVNQGSTPWHISGSVSVSNSTGTFLTINPDGSLNVNIVGGVMSVTATSPLSSTGGVNPVISIQQATALENGYLSDVDWITFDNAALATQAATSADTPSTIVKRDASGNFSAGTITASLTGNVSGNVSGSAATFTGSLAGDVTGTESATLVSKIDGNTVVGTTGTGNVVFSNAPALTLTNATGLPFSGGGTNNSTSYTAGSIIYSNGTSLTQDNANFFWNDANQSLGIGTNTPNSNTFLEAINLTGATKRIELTGYGTSSFVGFRGRFARGTATSPTAAQTGDTLDFISGQGYGTTGFPATSTGSIAIDAGGNFTDTSMPTYISFSVTGTGSIASTEAMRISPSGDLLIGTTTDSGTQKLQVNGNSNVGTVTAGIWNGSVTKGFAFLTSGTTYTTPAVISPNTLFTFTLIGGGGGGGGIATATAFGCGGGGAGVGILYINGLTPNTTYTIAIGAGGQGGTYTPSATPGAAGGTTSLTIGATTYTAAGGAGGPDTVSTYVGGAGGASTNCTINITGQNGAGNKVAGTQTPSAPGGSSGMGWGLGGVGNVAFIGDDGLGGTGYGGGGAGAGPGNGIAGAGSAGAIHILWDN